MLGHHNLLPLALPASGHLPVALFRSNQACRRPDFLQERRSNMHLKCKADSVRVPLHSLEPWLE